MRDTIECPDIVVPSGVALSVAIPYGEGLGDADRITIQSPAVFAETGSIAISNDFNVNYQRQGITFAAALAAATFADLVDAAGNLIALGGAGEALVIDAFPCAAFRIKLNGNAAADRTFKVYKQVAS